MKSLLTVTELQDVSETSLMTLYGRYKETKEVNGIVKDFQAVEIVEKIDYDFSKFDSWFIQAGVAIRTELFDNAIKDFLEKNPDSTIVNLGAGLCTRFFRLDNGIINWYELDLPRVKPVWDKLIGKTERHKYLAYSVTDLNWIEVVKKTCPKKVLFVLEGLTMYLPEAEIKKIFLAIKDNFPNSEILFDAIGELVLKGAFLDPILSKIKNMFQWGINDLKQIENWDSEISLFKQWYNSDYHKDRQRWMMILGYIPILRKQTKIGLIKFSQHSNKGEN